MSASEQLAYRSWRQMVKDAYAEAGKHYVGSVESTWRERFDNFQADMGLPAAGQKLKRHDAAQPFTKQNCFWE